MNENEINRKVNDTLNSIDNLNRSVPDGYLFIKIENRIKRNKSGFELKNSYIGKFAIGFAVLLIINIFSFLHYHSNQNNSSYITELTSSEYSSKVNEFARSYFYDENEYNYNK